jgi:hypothetical protein
MTTTTGFYDSYKRSHIINHIVSYFNLFSKGEKVWPCEEGQAWFNPALCA